MRQLIFAIVVLLWVLSSVQAQEATPTTPPPQPTPFIAPSDAPPPFETITTDGLTLDVLFGRLQQGRVGLLRLTGDDIIGARLRFFDKTTEFFADSAGAWYGLVVVGMDVTASRTYTFTVQAMRGDGPTVSMTGDVDVTLGGFIRQEVNVPGDRGYLIDPMVERSEFARLDSIFSVYTAERLWAEDGFQYPVNAETTSPFGSFRVFNGTTEARHTGWDIRAPVGTPVMAMGSGKVAYAGLLDIRGNHVIIDHGYGIFSGYSHFSQIHVTAGQTVTRGQIIGVTGNTGRSSGPHLHWEMTVNGEWIDSRDFLETWMP
jgi:hypothetical protein